MYKSLLSNYFITLIIIVLFSVNSYSQTVTWHEAKKIAITVSNNIIEDDSGRSNIKKVDMIKYQEKTIGYIFYFHPKGYVIIPRCREMKPLFAMSGSGNFETSINTIETFLKPAFTSKYISLANQNFPQNNMARNRSLWKQYLTE